ncbi:MAG: DUF5794 domain-containing protein [Halolamina sp.]
MSVSQHPIAVRLERQVGGATKLLATVMALPLVDGIFPALVVAGALSTPVGVVETGLLIFGGSATVAVILAEMDGDRRDQVRSVLVLGAVLIPVAVVEAALAQTLDSLLAFETFRRFAGLVILAVAAKTASAEVGEYLPRPGAIVLLGLVASIQPDGARMVVTPDLAVLARAGAAAGVGVAFALGVAVFGPHLRGRVNLDLFRFGSAVALGTLGLKVLGLLPTGGAPVALGVLAVTALFSYDSDVADEGDADLDSDDDAPPAATVADGGGEVAVDEPAVDKPVVDGSTTEADADTDEDESEGYEPADAADDRAPWL